MTGLWGPVPGGIQGQSPGRRPERRNPAEEKTKRYISIQILTLMVACLTNFEEGAINVVATVGEEQTENWGPVPLPEPQPKTITDHDR